MKTRLTFFLPLIFLLFLIRGAFPVNFGGEIKSFSTISLSKKHISSDKVFDKEHLKLSDNNGFTIDLTDDDFQSSDTSLIPFFASAAVIFGVVLHLFFREKTQSPSPLFSLNRNVNRRYILLENLRI